MFGICLQLLTSMNALMKVVTIARGSWGTNSFLSWPKRFNIGRSLNSLWSSTLFKVLHIHFQIWNLQGFIFPWKTSYRFYFLLIDYLIWSLWMLYLQCMYEFHVRNHCLVGETSYITLGNICIFLHEVNQTFIIFECLN